MYDRVLGIEDMHHFEASSAQHIGDQRSVTPPPNRFRTHQRRACGPCHLEQRSQAVGKLRTPRVRSGHAHTSSYTKRGVAFFQLI